VSSETLDLRGSGEGPVDSRRHVEIHDEVIPRMGNGDGFVSASATESAAMTTPVRKSAEVTKVASCFYRCTEVGLPLLWLDGDGNHTLGG
jgi:hypothetical protein